MSTLVYSPGIEVLIASKSGKIIDISDDIVSGQLQLAENQVHKGSVIIANEQLKYDGLFWPNDRIVIRMKRIRWLPIMSGYLNRVPMFSVYPRNVELSFSCSLKRLENTLFDPGSAAYTNFHNQRMATDAESSGSSDSGLGVLLRDFMVEVAGWDPDRVHVSDLPAGWVKGITEVYEKVSPFFQVKDLATLGSMSIPGQRPDAPGIEHPDSGRGYGLLPSATPRVGLLSNAERQRWSAEFRNPRRGAVMAPNAQSWRGIMARFPFGDIDAARGTVNSVQGLSREEQNAAVEWHKNKSVVLYNPSTNKAYRLLVGCWGPLDSVNSDAMVDQRVLDHLQANPGDLLQMRWAEDGAPSGPVSAQEVQAVQNPQAVSGPTPTQPFLTDVSQTLQRFTQEFGQRVSSSFSWQPRDLGPNTGAGLSRGNVAAAWDFIRANWPSAVLTSSNRPGDSGYHGRGAALDISHNQWRQREGRQVLSSIALWFAQNPRVFGLEQWIYWGWGSNGGSEWWPDTQNAHFNHVHLGFTSADSVRQGPSGNPWPIATNIESSPQWRSILAEGVANIGDIFTGLPDFDVAGDQAELISTRWNWSINPLANSLYGPRRLLNDVRVWEQVVKIANTGMRSFCSAPNGDFVAWYPDYFGKYGKLGAVEVELIEVNDFTLAWNDTNFKTHVFATGIVGSVSLNPDSAPGEALAQTQTHGIATVEFPEILDFVAGTRDHELWGDLNQVLQRFGARSSHTRMGTIATREGEFFMAIYRFMRSWASQYSTSITLTFMPELFPGMLLRIPVWGIQFYVTSVTHRWNLTSGGFDTIVDVISPSTIDEDGRGRWDDLTNKSVPIVRGGLDSSRMPPRATP